MPSVIAYIAVGANLGDREASIRNAVQQLNLLPQTRVLRQSTLLPFPAVGGPANSPDFLNGVIEIETTLDAHDLLHRLLEIERSMGRTRREKWEPRVIDLDIILYGDQINSDDDLVIPHPLMHTRRFVLEPLAEIAPNLRHSKLGETIPALLNRLSE